MNNSWANLDLRSLVENLRESVRNFGGFSPDQVRQAASMGEDALKTEILLALKSGAKTGHEILNAITESTHTSAKPKAATLYPLLEQMTDLGLVASSMKKDRKVYALTEAGLDAAESATPSNPEDAGDTSKTWGTPNWVDLRGELAVASKRLATVAFEVAQHGSKEQQTKAAEAIDHARRQLHEILAAE